MFYLHFHRKCVIGMYKKPLTTANLLDGEELAMWERTGISVFAISLRKGDFGVQETVDNVSCILQHFLI